MCIALFNTQKSALQQVTAQLLPCSPSLLLAGLQICPPPLQVHLAPHWPGQTELLGLKASRSLWQTYPVCFYSPHFSSLSLPSIVTGIQPVISFLVGQCGGHSLGCGMTQKIQAPSLATKIIQPPNLLPPTPAPPSHTFFPLSLGAPTPGS